MSGKNVYWGHRFPFQHKKYHKSFQKYLQKCMQCKKYGFFLLKNWQTAKFPDESETLVGIQFLQSRGSDDYHF